MIRIIRSFGSNTFAFAFVIYFIGFLSMSFLGQENKSLRIATTLLVLFILLFKAAGANKFFLKNRLSILFLIYICSLLPSLLFTDLFFMSVFKILDVVIIFLLINDSVKSFIIREVRITSFHFILYYFILQCVIILFGYFFDPNALREDFLQKGISFLSSNYPKIHSNTVGTFGGVVVLYAIFRLKAIPRNTLINTALLLLGLSVLILSSSRTSMLATLLGSAFLIVTMFTGKQKRYLLAALIISAAIFSTEIYEFGFKALMKMQTEESLANADNAADILLSGRLSLWQIILESPENLIFGRGFGTALLTESALNNTNAHNSVIELLINAGMLAVTLWLMIWWQLIRSYRYIVRNKSFLPLHPHCYHLSFSLLILVFVKSMANITFVYFQLFDWLIVSIICLYVCTEVKIKSNKKKFKYAFLNNQSSGEEKEGESRW